jgi:uncharacterized protein YecE (DUF72 family)
MRARPSARGRVYVGCSGWQYASWRGVFYPRGLPTSGWLAHYARTFDTVEVNGSFYRLPEPRAVKRWQAETPDEFVFAWKASRYLTHMKRLIAPRDPLRRLLGRARHLGHKLGPILYQLPTRWKKNEERLSAFVCKLPAALRHVVEFRDPSWYGEATASLLEQTGVGLCLHDMPDSKPARCVVGPFVYVRFHGTTGKYAGGYGARALASWASWLVAQANAGLDVYAYFNNDIEGHAVRDAVRLRDAIGRRV